VPHPSSLRARRRPDAEVEIGANIALDRAAGVERHGQAPVGRKGAGEDRRVGVEPEQLTHLVVGRIDRQRPASRQGQVGRPDRLAAIIRRQAEEGVARV